MMHYILLEIVNYLYFIIIKPFKSKILKLNIIIYYKKSLFQKL